MNTHYNFDSAIFYIGSVSCASTMIQDLTKILPVKNTNVREIFGKAAGFKSYNAFVASISNKPIILPTLDFFNKCCDLIKKDYGINMSDNLSEDMISLINDSFNRNKYAGKKTNILCIDTHMLEWGDYLETSANSKGNMLPDQHMASINDLISKILPKRVYAPAFGDIDKDLNFSIRVLSGPEMESPPEFPEFDSVDFVIALTAHNSCDDNSQSASMSTGFCTIMINLGDIKLETSELNSFSLAAPYCLSDAGDDHDFHAIVSPIKAYIEVMTSPETKGNYTDEFNCLNAEDETYNDESFHYCVDLTHSEEILKSSIDSIKPNYIIFPMVHSDPNNHSYEVNDNNDMESHNFNGVTFDHDNKVIEISLQNSAEMFYFYEWSNDGAVYNIPAQCYNMLKSSTYANYKIQAVSSSGIFDLFIDETNFITINEISSYASEIYAKYTCDDKKEITTKMFSSFLSDSGIYSVSANELIEHESGDMISNIFIGFDKHGEKSMSFEVRSIFGYSIAYSNLKDDLNTLPGGFIVNQVLEYQYSTEISQGGISCTDNLQESHYYCQIQEPKEPVNKSEQLNYGLFSFQMDCEMDFDKFISILSQDYDMDKLMKESMQSFPAFKDVSFTRLVLILEDTYNEDVRYALSSVDNVDYSKECLRKIELALLVKSRQRIKGDEVKFILASIMFTSATNEDMLEFKLRSMPMMMGYMPWLKSDQAFKSELGMGVGQVRFVDNCPHSDF